MTDLNDSGYQLPVRNEATRRVARGWLTLGVASLVAAGVYSILLVLARTPVVQELIPFIDFFHTALAVHVDLSAVIWLLSMAGLLWSLSSDRDLPRWDRVSLGHIHCRGSLLSYCSRSPCFWPRWGFVREVCTVPRW